jgi:CheY-like chemotaxis protein
VTRILLIDDDAVVRSAVKSMLEHAGFEIVEVESGLSAIQAVQTDRFDLAIVDIFMPEMDGLETIKALKERAPALRILAMSGFRPRLQSADGPDFLAMAVKLGAAHSLQKPFGTRELVQAVEISLAAGSAPDQDHPRAGYGSGRSKRPAFASAGH